MNIIWLFLLPLALTVAIGIYLNNHPLPDVRDIERRMEEIEEKIIYWIYDHRWKK